MSNEISQLKVSLASICKKIYLESLVKHGEGNVSLRVKDTNELIITPTGNNYSKPEPENMVHMKFDGEKIDVGLKPSSEFLMHSIIYQNRPKVKCILHTHSPFAASLAVSHKDLPVIIEEMALFLGGGVPCTEFASAGTDKVPIESLNAMKDQNAVLISNHGVLVVGSTSDYCIKTAVIIEKMAKIYINACLIGEPHVIPDEKIFHLKEIFRKRYSTV
ncbi:L-fuculose phosphate aldolase [Candidatus Lokiarchaeum ossiferum]|uniref:L-fuculose phosphate aldolase n=1 Tax=Candidatus Lokiarchaeum ossiferum TaxID=2951803 RepID=A0ABY6HTQ4_9ARCH|nr:L-fuculose phosphate aldolase [Candidatus Lokiarchaeum sp. B-35]